MRVHRCQGLHRGSIIAGRHHCITFHVQRSLSKRALYPSQRFSAADTPWISTISYFTHDVHASTVSAVSCFRWQRIPADCTRTLDLDNTKPPLLQPQACSYSTPLSRSWKHVWACSLARPLLSWPTSAVVDKAIEKQTVRKMIRGIPVRPTPVRGPLSPCFFRASGIRDGSSFVFFFWSPSCHLLTSPWSPLQL